MYVCMYVCLTLLWSTIIAFVVNHSFQYTVAALCSWLEFWMEAAVFGGRRKIVLPVAVVGLVAVLGGQVCVDLHIMISNIQYIHTYMVGFLLFTVKSHILDSIHAYILHCLK